MTKPRTPPIALVLLPALALAAVGVRAVTAEMRASEDAARERARSVASRLARSVDALVEEYAGPLPKSGSNLTTSAVDAAVAHLEPHALFEVPTSDQVGKSLWMSAPRRLSVWEFGSAADVELAKDALARAKRLADETNGPVAAAALLAATADVVKSPELLWPLRHAEARYEIAAGDPDRALAAVAAAWNGFGENFRGFRELDGTPYPEAALETATQIVRSSDPPEWLVSAYEYCSRRPFFEHEHPLFPLRMPFAGAAAERLRPAMRLRSTAMDIGGVSRASPPPAALLTLDSGMLRLSLWRAVETGGPPGLQLLGGEVPATVVSGRIAAEAHALAAETGVTSVRLVTATGRGVFDVAGTTTDARNAVAESVPLADPLSAWRAEAVVAPESGVPATAWMLASALVLTTTALVAGLLALRRAAERSARLAEDRQTFLDHVAHELRTPAAAVQALTEELASGHVAKEKEPQYRAHLLRESRRLSALVEDTLDLTRLDAGRLAFKMEPADLRDVVRRAIEESGVAGRVVATVPDAPVVRAVDEGTLRRAVKNLVENAVRHGGGDAPIRVALEARNGAASIAVTDQGRGIASEHLPRLFERFYRVPSATHEVKGVGLGLALCREVARAHGGDVTVSSRVGHGSTFTLRIPVGDGPHSSPLRGER